MTVLVFHNAVLDSNLPIGVKMALIALDRHRNHEGESVWPSVERLCQLSSSKKTAFMGYLKLAEDAGWLTRERRFNRSNVFALHIPEKPRQASDDVLMVQNSNHQNEIEPDKEIPIVQILNHQTVDSSESEPPIVRNLNFEVTKEVTNNLEVTKVIFAREENAESEPTTTTEPATIEASPESILRTSVVTHITDDMRRALKARRLPEFMLAEFDADYTISKHLYPDSLRAFTRYMNINGREALQRAAAH